MQPLFTVNHINIYVEHFYFNKLLQSWHENVIYSTVLKRLAKIQPGGIGFQASLMICCKKSNEGRIVILSLISTVFRILLWTLYINAVAVIKTKVRINSAAFFGVQFFVVVILMLETSYAKHLHENVEYFFKRFEPLTNCLLLSVFNLLLWLNVFWLWKKVFNMTQTTWKSVAFRQQ